MSAVGEAPKDPLSKAAVDLALAGNAAALHELVLCLTPVVHARVARTLLRRRARATGDLRAALEDLVQDTFVALLSDEAKLLRAWNPERGLRLDSFVGLVAEQRVLQTLRSRRRSPWAEELAIDDGDLDVPDSIDRSPEARAESREALEDLLDEVKMRLSPMGLELFLALVVHQEPIPSVCTRTKLSTSAVQAWSSRLKRLVQRLAGAERGDARVERRTE